MFGFEKKASVKYKKFNAVVGNYGLNNPLEHQGQRHSPILRAEIKRVENSVDVILSARPGEYVYYGSSMLEALGIRKAKDADVLVTPALYDELLRIYEVEGKSISPDMFTLEIQGKQYDIMRRWLDWNIGEAMKIIRRGQQINGKNFAVLADVLKYKMYLNRAKDEADIQQILAFIRERSTTGKRKRALAEHQAKIYSL